MKSFKRFLGIAVSFLHLSLIFNICIGSFILEIFKSISAKFIYKKTIVRISHALFTHVKDNICHKIMNGI